MRNGVHARARRFGGVYADLDVVPLRPLDGLLAGRRGAVLAKMGPDDAYDENVPNAWMASAPGHEFWLHAAGLVAARNARDGRAEHITGPVALYDAYKVRRHLRARAQLLG